MKIPADLIPVYRPDASNKALDESRKAEPVGEAARLDFAASSNSSKSSYSPNDPFRIIQPRLTEPRDENAVLPENSTEEIASVTEQAGEDRRKGNRRKHNRPVLLDTRSTRSRRESIRSASISFRI